MAIISYFQYVIIIGRFSRRPPASHKFMKNNKSMNFFDSPCPRSFNPSLMREDAIHHNDDSDIIENKSFNTPIKAVRNRKCQRVDIFFSQPKAYQKDGFDNGEQDEYDNYSQEQEPKEEDNQSYAVISQKLEYSEQEMEEELLLNITPEKEQTVQASNEFFTTIKKKVILSTPISQSKTSERGLKKLASEAYGFVRFQKKTTYKEVAKNMILSLQDESQIDLMTIQGMNQQKKGEMNIKRRVYDALNVLIALGLLKRNGNKISGRKLEFESGSERMNRQRQKNKEDLLEDELQNLRALHRQKQKIVKEKQQILNNIREKIQSLRELTENNQKNSNTTQLCIRSSNKIHFPLLSYCAVESSKGQEGHQEVKDRHQKIEFYMDNANVLKVKASSNMKATLLGDLDLIKYIKQGHKIHKEQQMDIQVSVEKVERVRRVKK